MGNPTDKIPVIKQLIGELTGKVFKPAIAAVELSGFTETHLLAKAHVDAYTRKDGVTINAHDTKVQAAQERPAAPVDDAPKAAKPADKPAPKPAEKPAAKPAGMFAQADHLKKFASTFQSDQSNNDREKIELAHEAMKDGDKEALKRHIGSADTYQREEILNHIHPDHWDELGAPAIDKPKQVAKHERRFGKPAASKAFEPKEVKSNNEDWGFHGEAVSASLRKQLGGDYEPGAAGEKHYKVANEHAVKKFSETANHLVQQGHFDDHDHARDFLDSRDGRHLHDAMGENNMDSDSSNVKWLPKAVKSFNGAKQ